MADKTKTPLTVDTAPAEKGAGEPLPTFTDLANNPKGITSRSTVAKLLEIHVLTLTRWIKAGKFVKPITIGNAHYFRNSELIDYLDNKTA